MKNYMKIIFVVVAVAAIGAAVYFSNTKLQTGRLGRIPTTVNEVRSDANQAANDLGQAATEFIDGLVADSCDSGLNPGLGQAILYENSGNGGKCITLAGIPGAKKNLIDTFNDMASSVKIGPNTRVKLWQHNGNESLGASYTVTASINNFANLNLENSNVGLNDQVSTVEFIELPPCNCNTPTLISCGAPVGPSELMGCKLNPACLSTTGTWCAAPFNSCSSVSKSCLPDNGINIFGGINYLSPETSVTGNISDLNQRLSFPMQSINKGNNVLSYTLFNKLNMGRGYGGASAVSYTGNIPNIITSSWGAGPVLSLSFCLAADNCGAAAACTTNTDSAYGDKINDYADASPLGPNSTKEGCSLSCNRCYKKNDAGNRCDFDNTQCSSSAEGTGGSPSRRVPMICTPSSNDDCKR